MVCVLEMFYENKLSETPMLVQELEVNTSLPTSGSDNPEHGFEALTWVVRKVLEEVFEATIKEISETLQVRCMDCGKKRGCGSPRLDLILRSVLECI
ncbi:hypothetical protein J1N35_037793 [Gossypium stocksii]|uniref:Uncharacterized protein n=1 Tax=Gossypium stocksii TaxID=47602 RepID=A0A9D3UMM8_9ROSI|nr:hypothetical protein J1N35_037793 [Gossypium stocksii]